MANYSTGTATGPGAVDALFQIIATALTSNGWTTHDTISSTTGSRDVVWKGTALDSTAGNAPFIRITQSNTTSLDFRCYVDWDASAHAGINEAGGIGSSRLSCQDATFTYWMRVNGVALTVVTKVSSSYYKAYVGFVRRPYTTARAGMTKTTASITANTSPTISVASDMTAKLAVGQVVQIVNYAHNNSSSNKSNVEIKTIASLTSSTITFTANVTNAYDSGALVGENVFPIAVTAHGNEAWDSSSWYLPWYFDGTRSGAVNQTAYGYGALITQYGAANPMAFTGEYATGVVSVGVQGGSYRNFLGCMYHWLAVNAGTQSKEDTVTDGTNTWIVLMWQGSGASTPNIMLGPQ